MAGKQNWWEGGVIYQIYPRSFADSNGDGIGDIAGIISKLEYLQWLGVDAIWLSPVHPSPNADWGYDVADYYDIHPDLGTLEDFDNLVAEAYRRGIRVVMDLVPNHTSDENQWFKQSRASRDNPKRDWYVWTDKPNNWKGYFGGSAWTKDRSTGQYFLHNFLRQQPDLNWWNQEVLEEFDKILMFWFERGVAGFRIDVANAIVKDRQLRDNPPYRGRDFSKKLIGQEFVYNSNRPEVHDVHRRWRKVADSYQPAKLLLGETNVWDLHDMAKYYGQGDELSLAFNFLFWGSKFDPDNLRRVAESTYDALGDNIPVWAGSNHDHPGRFPSRWAGGDERKIKLALMMLLLLKGTTVLYYGDEIGMPNTKVTRWQMQDPVGKRYWPFNAGRDKARTPMVWEDSPGAGFAGPGVKTWLPIGSRRANVADQQADADSALGFVRRLIKLRKDNTPLQTASYQPLKSPPGVWMWRRGKFTVALNFNDHPVAISAEGEAVLSSNPRRSSQSPAELAALEGLVIRKDIS